MPLERALGAAVGFYGGGIVHARFPQFPALVDRAARLQTPWLGLFGDQDAGIPVDDVEALRAALADAPVDSEIVRYADAEHGFHCDVRPAYNPAAADRRLGPHPRAGSTPTSDPREPPFDHAHVYAVNPASDRHSGSARPAR